MSARLVSAAAALPGVQAVELVQLAITGALFAAVVWRGLVARRLGELWWCSLSVAIAALLGVDAVAAGLDGVAALPVSGLLARMAAVSAVALALRWLLRHRQVAGGTGRVGRRLSPGVTIPIAVTGVAAAAHWAGFAVFLLAALAVFLGLGLREVDLLPTGRLRAALLLLLVAAAALFLWVVTAAGVQLVGQLGIRPPVALPPTLDYLLTAVLAVFTAGVLAPLPGGARGGPGLDGTSVHAELVALWTWLTRSPAAPGAPAAAGQPVDAVLDLVIEIRDQVHDLQRFLTPAAVELVAASSRRASPPGVDADAWTTAVCLELASATRIRGESPACAGVDLSALGGGDCLAAEAEWLARVSSARRSGARP